MAGEGPPFLTVGTDVSAKYRGAFCEAKVKVVKKLVKCKVNFKNGTSCIISDDFIKGTLKVGAKIEAKMTENGSYEEGTIMKLNDASLYTVVFDDGDEKTLRRTLLCLQGEKHFHESETLDHLPLTDPENFGTPVVRDSNKKIRRKRRMSNRSHRSEDDDEEEEEDDEEADSEVDSAKKQRKEEPEDAVGKVVIVEINEKRKNSFFPALVVDPSCTKDVQMKGKDQIVARSFKDNKFYTVAKSSRKAFLTKDHVYKGDVASLKAATEKAVTFIDTGQLPSNWDLDMLKKKRSSKQGPLESSDETSEDSSDDEYDMEKDAWLASLHKFMEERGTPINKPPVLGFRDLNLYKLYKLVQELGGCRKVTDKQQWRYIMTKMGIQASVPAQPYNIHTAYNKYLFAFEEFNRKMGPGPRVFTRTRRRSFEPGWISPPVIQRQRSVIKQEVKDDQSDKEEEEEESPSKKRTPITRKKVEELSRQQEPPEETRRETREVKTRSKEQEREEKESAEREEKRSSKKPTKEDKTRDKSKEEAKEKATKEESSEKAVEERSKEKSRDTKGKDKKEEKGDEKPDAKAKEKTKEAKGKDKKPKAKADSPREDESSSVSIDAGYEVGEKVLVHYGRGRTEKIYEAKVVDIEVKGKDPVFTVHYTGWNNRYDEAVKKNRIMGSAEKKKKKTTPKGKGEKEKSKKEMDRKEKEEQIRKEKEEEERKEQEEKERKAKLERELKERQEKEKLEKEKAEKERLEKERREKQEKERKEKERKEKLEKERAEKERKDRLEKERKEKLERERQEKELKERLEKEKAEQERKERQEKEKKEKQEKERREKLERERKEQERLEQEKRDRELAEKAKEAEKERKEKEKGSKDVKKTPTGKRGRPSVGRASPAAQTPPRSSSSGRGKSPSPASVFSQRSMRSDRKSFTDLPYASGLNVRSRPKRYSTGEYRRGTMDGDSDSEMDDFDAQSESQQSTQDSEDSQVKDSRVQDQEEVDDTERSKMEDYAATLIKVGEQKPSFDDDNDDGPPKLTRQVGPDAAEAVLPDADSEAPKMEEAAKASEEKEGRARSKKDSKIRLRKSVDRNRESSKEPVLDSQPGEREATVAASKESSEKEETKEKLDETPVLERQVPVDAEPQESTEELKQETKESAVDAEKPAEKKKSRRKGRKSIEGRKRTKNEAEAEVSEKSETSETSEPKKKHAKMDRRKSEKGAKKSKEPESKAPDNTDSDFASSSVDDKSLPGTSKTFMTTPPTTPESSPKAPSSPSQEEDLPVKAEEQNSNKSDSDALIEVASIDDNRDALQAVDTEISPLNSSMSSSAPKKSTAASERPDPSPKKRRRGTSESEQGKKRRKHSRRRQSSISERRSSTKERVNNNSSDTDESRTEVHVRASSSKHHMALKAFTGNLPSMVTSNTGQEGSQRQCRWNFLVDLSNVKEPDERIAIIQHQLTELRSVYLQLKQEVATIDRRRKKFRKKEREAAQVMAGVAMGHCMQPQGVEKVESGSS